MGGRQKGGDRRGCLPQTALPHNRRQKALRHIITFIYEMLILVLSGSKKEELMCVRLCV